MNRLLLASSLALLAPAATAQNCFDGDFGVIIYSTSPILSDWVSPMMPIGFAFPIGGTTYTDIHVSDHGLVFLSNGGVPVPPASQDPILYTATPANFAGGSPKVCALYNDIVYNPMTTMWFKSSATKCTVTWQDMQNWGIPGFFSFQMTLFPSGDVRIVYGPGCTNDSMFGGLSANGIAGISPGGGVSLSSPVDLSAGGTTAATSVFEEWTTPHTFDMAVNTLVFTATAPAGYSWTTLGPAANCAAATVNGYTCGASLQALGRPSFGNTNFRFELWLNPTHPLGFLAFGTVGYPAPGLSLAGIGMPSCSAYTNLDIGLFPVPMTNGVGFFPLPIPNAPTLVGATLAAQGVGPGNTPLGLVASYGFDLVVGYGY